MVTCTSCPVLEWEGSEAYASCWLAEFLELGAKFLLSGGNSLKKKPLTSFLHIPA